MTGAELKKLREDLGEAIGRPLAVADMAKLCGLKDPEGNGRDTYRKWEDGDGPSGPVAMLLSLYAAGIDVDVWVTMTQEIRLRLDLDV